MGFGGSERQQRVDLRPAMVGVMSTILHHKHPTSVTENLALKSLLLTTLGAPGSVQRLENQLGAGFSRQTSNAMLSNLISDTGNVVREWKSRSERAAATFESRRPAGQGFVPLRHELALAQGHRAARANDGHASWGRELAGGQ